jgi:hypothetical protein
MFLTLFIHLNEQEVGMLFRDFENRYFGIETRLSVSVIQGGFLLC